MRISDWSSDVCSSDLVVDVHLIALAAELLGGGEAAGAGTDDADRLRALARRRHRLHPAFLPGGVGDVLLDRADGDRAVARLLDDTVAFAERSEEHTSELQSLMRISYAVFCLKKKTTQRRL